MKNAVFSFVAHSKTLNWYETLTDEEQSAVQSTKYTSRAQEKYACFF